MLIGAFQALTRPRSWTTLLLVLAGLSLAAVAACVPDRDPAAPNSVTLEPPNPVQCIDNGCCGLCAPGPNASQDDSLSISCSPSPVLPSATVTCTATLPPGHTFTASTFVDIRSTDPDPLGLPPTTLRLPDSAGTLYQGKTSWSTSGRAIFSSELTVDAIANPPNGGIAYHVVRSTRFAINWGPEYVMQLPSPPTELPETLNDGEMKPVFQGGQGGYGIKLAEWIEPRINGGIGNVQDDLATGTLGNLPVDTALTGPNIGYKRLHNLLSFFAPVVRTSPAIYGHGSFAADQNGVEEATGATQKNGLPYCNSNVFPALQTHVLQHEGVNPGATSHYGIYQTSFAGRHVGEGLRRLYYPNGADRLTMRAKINKTLMQLIAPDTVLHYSLDATDQATLDANLGCALDLTPGD